MPDNKDPKGPYDFVNGKCSDEYPGETADKLQEGEAPKLDMGKAPITPITKERRW